MIKKMKLYHFSGFFLFICIAFNSYMKAYGYYFEGDLSTRFFTDAIAAFLCGTFLTKTKEDIYWGKKSLYLLLPFLAFIWFLNIVDYSAFVVKYYAVHTFGLLFGGILGIFMAQANIKRLIFATVFFLISISLFSFKFIPYISFTFSANNYFVSAQNSGLSSFYLFDKEDKKVNFDMKSNKTYVIDFWSKNCGICFASFPYLEKLYQKYENNINVEVLIVNVSGKGEYKLGEWQKNKYVQKHNMPFYHDEDKILYKQIMKEPNDPQMFIFDKSGKLVFHHSGFTLDEKDIFVDKISKQIEKLF